MFRRPIYSVLRLAGAQQPTHPQWGFRCYSINPIWCLDSFPDLLLRRLPLKLLPLKLLRLILYL